MIASPTAARSCTEGCLLPGASPGSVCDAPIPPDAPLPLCDAHLRLAAEWNESRFGQADLLPSPCVVCGSRLGVRYPSGWICAVCEWRWGDSPSNDLPRPRVDVVYYLRFDDRVKIGTTANPRQRFRALPHHEVLAFERGGRALEQRRHAEFAAHRIPGTEWFEQSDALDAHIARIAAAGYDPWELFDRWCSEALALQG